MRVACANPRRPFCARQSALLPWWQGLRRSSIFPDGPFVSIPLVPVDAVPNAGLDVPVGAWAQAAVAEAFGPSTVSGALRVVRKGPHLVVTGALSLACSVPCDRCRKSIPLALAPELACVYSPITAVPERSEADDASGPAFPEDLPVEVQDAGEYDGVALDLAAVVVESLEVERPARWRCVDAFPDDPQSDTECQARWVAASGVPDVASPSPFAALAGWSPTSRGKPA